MTREPIFIYDRNIKITHILAIEPYKPPIDPAREIWDDLNSAVLLTRRPHRLPARRDPEALAQQLGFFYLPLDRIGLNPECRIVVEPFAPKDEMDILRFPNAATRLTLNRTGFKRTLMLKTDPATVSRIVSAMPLRPPVFDCPNGSGRARDKNNPA